MALSDWIPPYWKNTRDFQQIKVALDDGVQPDVNFAEQFFQRLANPSAWPDEVLTPLLTMCGYTEAATATRDRKEVLIRRALRTRGLITEQMFVDYLREAFGLESGDPEPYNLVIYPQSTSVAVSAPCEACSDNTHTYGDAYSFVYDNLMGNLQYSFPAGVNLELVCELPEKTVQRYYGAVGATTVEIQSQLVVGWSAVEVYDIAMNPQDDAEYNPFEGYRVNGITYATEQELNGAYYFLAFNPVYLGEVSKLALKRYDGYVNIEDVGVFETWEHYHNTYGYTRVPTNEITVYDENNAWNAVSAYHNPETGEYYTESSWYADEEALNSAGYYLEIPIVNVGMTYGLMTAWGADIETGTIEQGTTGYPSLIHGDLIDAGIGEYGVM